MEGREGKGREGKESAPFPLDLNPGDATGAAPGKFIPKIRNVDDFEILKLTFSHDFCAW